MDIKQLQAKFTEIYGSSTEPVQAFFAPGRVNLIGEHIDYNGGYVFPAALTIGIAALVRPNGKQVIRLNSLNAQGEIRVDLSQPIVYAEQDSWGNYPKGVFAYLLQEGKTLAGYDILFAGNLPDGAGLSSSAAIEVLTTYMMLSLAGEKDIDLVWVARFCQKVENQFVGVNCGIMDQFSVALGKQNQAILLDCQTLNYKYAPFELEGYSLIIMNTNKRRELADSKYNERRAECDQVLAILNKAGFAYNDLCSATLAAIDTHITDPVLYKRARHVVSENERVLQAVDVLEQGSIEAFGLLLNASHASLKDDYEVTGHELDTIVAEAQKHSGCLGARMTGAGFGGCAIALVSNNSIEDFKQKVGEAYHLQTGLRADFYVSSIGNGVHAAQEIEL